MVSIGYDAAKSLVERAMNHPVFGRLVLTPPEGVRKDMAIALQKIERPTLLNLKEEKDIEIDDFYTALDDDNYEYGLYPINRACKNSLLFRAIVLMEGFKRYYPRKYKSKLQVPSELKEESVGRAKIVYRTKEIVHEARVHPESYRAIVNTDVDFFAVGKLRNRWKIEDIFYIIDLPLFVVPGLDPRKMLALELGLMTCKRSTYKNFGYRGISYSNYTAATEDHEFLVRLLQKENYGPAEN
mgnify:CR=1 FL=1